MHSTLQCCLVRPLRTPRRLPSSSARRRPCRELRPRTGREALWQSTVSASRRRARGCEVLRRVLRRTCAPHGGVLLLERDDEQRRRRLGIQVPVARERKAPSLQSRTRLHRQRTVRTRRSQRTDTRAPCHTRHFLLDGGAAHQIESDLTWSYSGSTVRSSLSSGC
eukprot:2912355-Prymnesium_polylepis.1